MQRTASSPVAVTARDRFHLINGYRLAKMTKNPSKVVADDLRGGVRLRIVPAGWQQGVTLPAAKKSRSIAVMVGLEGAFLGDVDVGGLFWRQFG